MRMALLVLVPPPVWAHSSIRFLRRESPLLCRRLARPRDAHAARNAQINATETFKKLRGFTAWKTKHEMVGQTLEDDEGVPFEIIGWLPENKREDQQELWHARFSLHVHAVTSHLLLDFKFLTLGFRFQCAGCFVSFVHSFIHLSFDVFVFLCFACLRKGFLYRF